MSAELSTKYQKKTDKEHILDNPDTYTGSMDMLDNQLFIFNTAANTAGTINQKTIQYIPGLYKLFDEACVNCYDHSVRMRQLIDTLPENNDENNFPVSLIDVSITDDGVISLLNDGNGIDIAKHPTYDLWIPEMIFAHLRTGTNYNKDEKKIVGGKNGFGAKLIFIWSEFGSLETIDHKRGLKFVQEYKSNLDFIGKPKITKCKRKPYTKITFKPDYKRLGISNISEDIKALFKKRVYDISALTGKGVRVKYNGELISAKTFPQYFDLYIGNKTDTKRIYESGNDRWEYAVCVSPSDEFQHVSFVNGIFTAKGGKHVDYILNQITKKLVAYIQKKKKIDVKPSTIKEQIMLFLRCDIENPAFESQTKDYMSTPSSKFGSSCTISDTFIDKIAKLGIMNTACELTSVKANKTAKKTDGAKTKSIRGIPKLVDANWAGTAKSAQCSIIFCEGDSAKAGIISGLSKEDRNMIGVYPMKGKMFNVRGETMKRISENKEFIEIKQILGLETNKVYNTIEDVNSRLRYGKIIFMTDQDLDGSHIKGLGINLFQSLWESLIKLNIIGFMNTPILKARKGNQELLFYNDGEYEQWKQSMNEQTIHSWKIKYYKGLGTSTSKEFKEYFKNKKMVMFQYTDESNNSIDMVFNKKRADDRKLWLENYNRHDFLDTNQEQVSYTSFINNEMKHFSKYDCDRSIPNLMDGQKISQRKILYSAFKKRLNSEIKVAQFSGYVSEHSGYHHGEASLNGAIVGMAQDYVGSNNINLLLPKGQFGTRLNGGKDSASERYIFTQMNPITTKIFNEYDNKILRYLDDDGTIVEPIFYAPIIPMILVNGTKGIGTGFSTDIMPYNPKDIVTYLLNKLGGMTSDAQKELTPYYRGFKGTIIKIEKQKYLIKGCYKKIAENKIQIMELPIGTWTDDYKRFIEGLIDGTKGKDKKSIIKDYNDMSTDKTVDITVIFQKGVLAALETKKIDDYSNELEKYLKLFTTHTTTNMYLFNAKEQLKKYAKVEEIIDDYFRERKDLYRKRIDYIIDIIQKELVLLSNKAKYIVENLEGTIDLRRKKKEDILNLLAHKNYEVIDGDKEYKYLLKMTMDSVSEENVEKLLEQKNKKKEELVSYQQLTPEKLWTQELTDLMSML